MKYLHNKFKAICKEHNRADNIIRFSNTIFKATEMNSYYIINKDGSHDIHLDPTDNIEERQIIIEFAMFVHGLDQQELLK